LWLKNRSDDLRVGGERPIKLGDAGSPRNIFRYGPQEMSPQEVALEGWVREPNRLTSPTKLRIPV